MKKLMGISKFNLILALLVFCIIAGPACAAELSGNNNIGVDVGNDNGIYLGTGSTYQLNLESDTADLHIASDPANSAGDITMVNATSGTFYITCTNDSRVFDDTVLMLAVNGTIPDNFFVSITSSGYRWDGPAESGTLPEYGNLAYASSALSETFEKADLSYGPQTWKPSYSADSPVYPGQGADDTFSLVFIDLNAGVLCNAENLSAPGDLTDGGAVRIDYTFENPGSLAVFNAYGLTNTTSAEIVTTNDASESLYSVLIEEDETGPVPDSIEVSPSTASLEVNETAIFTATAYDTEGSEITGITFNWSVSDETIGNVTATGLFTGLSAGTVSVNASCGNVTGTAFVTVSEAVVPTPAQAPAPETYGGVIPAVDNVYLKVANDYGARFDDFENDTFRIRWTGGGQNAIHISQSTGGYGQVTNTNSMTGTFYVTETGGRGYHDTIFLCVAVNGTISDNFRMHITADGYQWTPNATPHTEPVAEEIEYINPTIDEWFDKDDFIYGPQTWRPAAGTQYPVFPGQNVSDTSNTFRMMFIDLNGGILSAHTLRVQYEIENLNTMAAFNIYGYGQNADEVNDCLTTWTNRLLGETAEFSGWYVSGAPLPDAASVVIDPVSASVPVNGKQQFTATAYDYDTNEISGAPITWSILNSSVGTIDADGLFLPASEGSTVITATADSGVNRTASVMVTAAVEKVMTTITLDPDSVLMYTDQIGNLTFTVTGCDQFGDEISAVYTWSSTDQGVGSIDQTGFFTGKTEGKTVVSATNGSISQTATVEIKQHPDWNVTLTGAINRTLNRTDIIDLSSSGMISYTDTRDIFWEGVNLTSVIGLFDDHDPSTFNTTLADLDYNITIKGKASGNEKTVLITSRELINTDKTFIAAYKMDGYEVPEAPVSGRTYWPLKLTGSAIANYGRNLEEISNITIDFPPDVRRIGITSDSVITFAGGSTIQFAATAYDSADLVVNYIPFTWSVSDSTIGTVDRNGLFTPLKSGTVNVTATYKNVNGSVTVSVLDDSGAIFWTVDQSGNGDFLTIQGAIDYAREGDTIVVRDGIYEEKVTIDKGLTLRSENGYDTTVIDDSAHEEYAVTVGADNVRISGFNFTGYPSTSMGSGALYVVGNNCVISNNLFPTARTTVSLEDSTIENNTFIQKGYLTVGTSNNLTVRNNVIDNSHTAAFEFKGVGSDLVIFNNSITSPGFTNGIELFGAYDNVTVSDNKITTGMNGIAIDVGENSDVNSAKILNNSIQSKYFAVSIYQEGEDIEISGNRLCSAEQYTISIRSNPGPISIHDNEILNSGITYAIYVRAPLADFSMYNNEITVNGTGSYVLYLRDCGDYLNLYLNNFSIGSSYTEGLFSKYKPSTLNSTKQYTYEYNGETFTGFIGNQYNTYSGIDTTGDFLGNTPFVEDGVYDYHPLTGTYSDYRILGEGKVDTGEQSTSLNFTGLGVQTTAENRTAVTVNTTQTQTTRNGNTLTISRANYDVDIELDNDMATNGDQVTGTVKSVKLTTSSISKSGGDAGNISASVVANLKGIPNGAGISATLTDGATGQQKSAFQLAASGKGLRVGAVACTLTVTRHNLENGEDVSSATIRLSADRAWVRAHGGSDSIKIIRWAEDGTKEVLDTVSLGYSGNMEIFEAYSPNGLSVFGLAATSAAPSSPAAGTNTVKFSSSTGSGQSDIATEYAEDIAAGETASLTFDESAVTKIDVKAAAEIPELMLTVEEVSRPSGIEDAPDEVYQYVEIIAYRAPEDSVARATIHFDVAKDWIDSISSSPADVSVYRYDEDSWEWVLLSTVSDGSDVYACNFFADTGEFGIFAITAKKDTASQSGPSNPATGPSSEQGASQSSESQSTTEIGQGIPLSYIILATGLVIGIPAAGYRWLRRKKK